MTDVKINPDLRHLYLSVMAPTTGLTTKDIIGNTVKIKPTTTDEYPRCIDIVDKKGITGAEPE